MFVLYEILGAVGLVIVVWAVWELLVTYTGRGRDRRPWSWWRKK